MPLTSGGCGRALALAAAAWALSAPAHAQTLAAPAARSQSTQTPKSPVTFRMAEHPSIRAGDAFRLDFKARFQIDSKSSDAPIEDQNEPGFDIARRRVGFEGEIMKAVQFEVDYELGSSNPWRDVFVNVSRFEFAQVQYGKFKLPFGLEETTSTTNLDFVYRSRISSLLSPGRDKGIMFHGRAANRMVRYEYGIFDHDGDNARTNNPDRVYGGQTKAGRVTVQPLRSIKSKVNDLQIGLAFTQSDVAEGTPAIRGRTVLDSEFFSPDYYVLGRRQRLGFEMRWRPGPASIKAEWIRVTDERLGLGVEDNDLTPFPSKGWYISGAVVVTGENKADGPETTKRPVHKGGPGAIEVGVRIEKIQFGIVSDELPSTSPRADIYLNNADRVTTFGVNWYLNRWIKIQYNIIREELTNPDLGPLPSKPSFNSRVFRFQFTL